MSVNRRSFIKSGAMSALTAAFGLVYAAPARGQKKPKSYVLAGPRPTPQIPFGAQQSPLFYFTRETFLPYVGGIFIARAGSNSARMTLVEVIDCTPKAAATPAPGGAPRTGSFILKFSSADKLTDLTTVYDIEHGALGEFPLFLTRREGPAGTWIYEAVFNHLI